MRLNSPSLTLQFLGTDLPTGHGGTQTISECYIVKGSISQKPQLLNGLKPSGSICNITISRDCLSTEDIIATDGDIKAVLSDGGNIIFTGYLSTKYSWTVGNHGEEALSLTLEDMGARLLGKHFLESGYHVFNSTASAAISTVCTACGITISPTAETITDPIFIVVDSTMSCKQIIEQILYECNYVYFFNNLGHMDFFEVDISSTTGQIIGSSKLIVRNGNAITLSKDVRTYRSARVIYTPLGTADNYLVYRNTTNQDSSHPYCYIELNPGEHFDGAEIYTAQEWAAATADTFRLPTLIGAVNADSETSRVGSNKILAVSNVVATIDKDSAITATIIGYGGPYLKIDCENTGSSKAYIRRLDAFASIVYEKSTNIVNAGVNDTSTQSRLDETLTCIHDLDAVSRHANLLAQFNAYCNSKYTFSTKEVLNLGEIVTLNDDVYTGLNVSVMVIGYTDTDNMDTIDYTAIGVSVFDLDKESYHQITEMGKAETRGPSGLSAYIQYGLSSSPDNPPISGPMFWNGEPMLWLGEPMVWDGAVWQDDTPPLQRGQYLWMRTKVGEDGEWAYSRLTGTYIDSEQFLGAVSEIPTQTPDGKDLIEGDYFVASVEFTDGDLTYRQGFVYEKTATSWRQMNASEPNNMGKMMQCLGGVLENGANVADSQAAIYAWFKVLTTQTAIIQNLLTRNIQVGDGDGTEGSGFRFRAREYDQYGNKLTHPDFDVYFGDKMLFDVDTDGKIFFGQGFWYDPSEGSIHSTNDNVVINAGGSITIKNGLYQSNLLCPSFRSMPKDPPPTPTYINISGGARQQFTTLYNAIGRPTAGELMPCTHSGDSSVKFLRYTPNGSYVINYEFLNSSGSRVGLISALVTGSQITGAESTWAGTSFTLALGSATDVAFQLLTMDGTLSIGSLTSSTQKGELYYIADSGGSTGTVHIKL